MTYLSPSEEAARLRREILESGQTSNTDIEELQRQVAVLNAEVLTDPNFPAATRQGINNLIRNSDHNHSVDTWFNSSTAGPNQTNECANVYAYPKLDPVTITDAAMTSGSNILNSASNPFTTAMNGRRAIVEGAGASGAKLGNIQFPVMAHHIITNKKLACSFLRLF